MSATHYAIHDGVHKRTREDDARSVVAIIDTSEVITAGDHSAQFSAWMALGEHLLERMQPGPEWHAVVVAVAHAKAAASGGETPVQKVMITTSELMSWVRAVGGEDMFRRLQRMTLAKCQGSDPLEVL